MKYGTPQAAMRATITQREGPELDRLGRGVVGWRLCGTFDPRKGRPVRRLPSMFCSSGLPFPSPGHPLRRWSLCGAGCGPGTPLDTAMEATRQLVKVVKSNVLPWSMLMLLLLLPRALQCSSTGLAAACPALTLPVSCAVSQSHPLALLPGLGRTVEPAAMAGRRRAR